MRPSALTWLALAATVLAAPSSVHAVANIDTDGYAADGTTTYCQQVTDEKSANEFLTLTPTSAGKCAVSIEMTITVRSFTMVTTVVDVSWSVALSLEPTTNVLFPADLDEQNLIHITPILHACKAGSNCATPDDVVVATVVGTERTGLQLDPQVNGAVELSSYEFQFPASGEYVIVADVLLPSGGIMVDNVVFQHVRATSDGVVSPGVISPEDRTSDEPSPSMPPVGFGFINTTNAPELGAENGVAPTNAPAANVVDAQEAMGSGLSASAPQRNGTMTALLLASVGAVGAVVGVLFFVSAQKNKAAAANAEASNAPTSDPLDGLDNHNMYRLTDLAQSMHVGSHYRGNPHSSIRSIESSEVNSVGTHSNSDGSDFLTFSTLRGSSARGSDAALEDAPTLASRTIATSDLGVHVPMTLTEMMATADRQLRVADLKNATTSQRSNASERSSTDETFWF